MNTLPWISHLCQGLKWSQVKTIGAIFTALIQCESAILNRIAEKMTHHTGVAVDHTLKRIQRFLGNDKVDRKVVYANITRFVWRWIRHWKTVPIAMDWTICERREKWQILAASVIVRGRGIPILLWAFPKNDFGKHLSQNHVEKAFLDELQSLIGPCQRKKQTIVILADRGFARPALFQHICALGWHYVIRVKHNVSVSVDTHTFMIGHIALKHGEVREFKSVSYRSDGIVVIPRLVAARATAAQEKKFDPWFLASSLPRQATTIVNLYSLRFTIEEDFRTMKTDLGFSDCRIRRLAHYRQFLLLMALVLVFAFLVGLAAHRKPSLARHITRRRAGKLDTSISVVGIRLLRYSFDTLAYISKIDKIPCPV